MGAVQLTLGLVLFTMGSRSVPAAQLSLIALVEPILSPLWAWFVSRELPPVWTFIGGAVIVGAIVIQALFSATRENPMPDAKPNPSAAASQLSTIRDFLRWAMTEFRRAKVVHGHGTTSAIDEAAFLILETLHLPVDDINPWLDATLLDTRARGPGRTSSAHGSRRACPPPIW